MTSTTSPTSTEEFERFTAFCASEIGWKSVWENHDKSVQVWEQTHASSSVKAVRVQAHYADIDAGTLYDVIHDGDYRRVWDDNMEDGYTVDTIDANNEVCYFAVSLIGFKNRDFVTKRSWRVKENKEFIILCQSVSHPKAPEKPGFVRGNTILTGYWIQRYGTGCILTFVSQTDLKGWLPSCVTKWLAPSVISNLKDAASNYLEWKSKHNPEYKPWRGSTNSPSRYYYQRFGGYPIAK